MADLPATPEDKAERLQEVSEQMEELAAEAERLSAERILLMVGLHDDGWDNVRITGATKTPKTPKGLTRQRVSTILKPILDKRTSA